MPSVSLCRWLCWTWLLLLAGCTDPYLPDVVKSPPSYLVVDGFLNSQGITTIKLSRTYALGSAAKAPVEAKATAYLEEENGPRTLLREAPAGTYSSPALILNPAKRYRLYLNTLANKQYASDFVPVKTTPPIDAVSWDLDKEFNVYVSAHDATNATRYYRWDYEETWEIRPAYSTSLEYVNHMMQFRQVPYPAVCWGNDVTKNVEIDKTTNLSQDVVAAHRLRVLPGNTERLFQRYSMLVRQYALTKDEYNYWELLRKNTESIGSLFDPQPLQLTGNVHGLSPSADVAIGYVGAHSVTEKRIFITHADLPPAATILSGYEKCIPPDTLDLYPGIAESPESIMDRAFWDFKRIPVGEIRSPSGRIVIAYFMTVPDCLDCRLRGTAIKPSFWP